MIRERLGHASIQVTMDTYGHPVEGLDRDAATKLALRCRHSEATGALDKAAKSRRSGQEIRSRLLTRKITT